MKPRNRPLLLISVATLTFACAGQASAQGWIVGASIGQADQDGYDSGGIPLNVKDDSSDTSLSIFGGYIFNDWLGIAAEYIDLGDASYAAAFGSESGSETQSATGIDISAVFMKALGSGERFTIFGSVGIFDFEQDVTWYYADSSIPYSESWSGTDSGTSVSYGVGFAIPFGDDGWGFHGEYKMFPDIGDEDENSGSGHEYDRSVIQFGIHKMLGGNGN